MNTYLAIAIEQIYRNSVQNKRNRVEMVIIHAESITEAKKIIKQKEPEKTWAVGPDAVFSKNLVMKTLFKS